MYRHQGMLPIGGMGCACGVPMGADDAPPTSQASLGSGTTWVSGGLLVGLAVVMFAIDTKDPLGLKKTR